MGHEMNLSLFPAHFVDSVRILFDLLDTEHVGYVTYKQVADRLPELPSTQLPPNFLQHLSRFTPPNGHILFQHFFATVRAAIHEQKTQFSDQNGIDGEKRRLAPIMGLNQQNRRSAYIPQSSYCCTDSNESVSQQSQPEFVKMREKKTQKSIRSSSSQPQAYRFRPLSTNSICSLGSVGTNDLRWRNSHVSSSLSSGSSQQTTTQDSTLIVRC
uniref:EF-hand domain-containing protein n=1 Tax=Syphacia muris TaxID=451379 RepID=A0A0N5AHP4_9BILA